MAMVNQEFESAPMGRLVIARTAAILAVVFAAMIANMVVMFRVLPGRAPRKGLAVGAVAPLVVLVVVVPLFLVERSKTARFRIDENCLVLGSRRYPLAGLARDRPRPGDPPLGDQDEGKRRTWRRSGDATGASSPASSTPS